MAFGLRQRACITVVVNTVTERFSVIPSGNSGRFVNVTIHFVEKVLLPMLPGTQMQIPACPPGPKSAMACHFHTHGWKWDEELMLDIICQLANEDVCDPCDLHGVSIADVDGAQAWPAEVRDYVQNLCKARNCS